MIRLVDFLKLPSNKAKIKFNMNPSDPTKRAWDLLLDDSIEWDNMNAYKTKHASNNLSDAEYLISFA